MSVLELKDLKKIYHKGDTEVVALDGLSMNVEPGEFLAIVGPSGSGKTTLLNIIGCLDRPTTGSVIYEGTNLGSATQKELSEYRKNRISFIFQSYNLIPVLTVLENVELPLVIEKKHDKKVMRAKALEMIESVGLQGKEDRYPRELSGGQEQRVAIARALVKEPFVVLADEPTANLDSHTAEEIIEVMKRINAKRGTTFVFSTHDKLVMQHARRVVGIRDGLLVSDERK
jgi:putative ABC transport system ATP-binding protein